MRFLLSVLWYVAIAAAAWHTFAMNRGAARELAPLERARISARALGVAGMLLWCFFVLDEARREFRVIDDLLDAMTWLGLLGTAVIGAVLIVGPLSVPRWLLAGRPGTVRCSAAALLGGAVTVFAFACVAGAAVMFLFASSAAEWVRSMLGVALPLGAVMIVSMTLSATARMAAADRRG